MEGNKVDLEGDHGHRYQEVDINISGGNVVLGNISSPDGFPKSTKTREEAEKAVFDALQYDNMKTRGNQLDQEKFEPSSFEWVWTTTFLEWLQHGDKLFWIAGKPASGKSTLMRFLTKDHRTATHLKRSGQKWEIVHFFFDFRAGGAMANSEEGMIRSFLSQLATSLLDVMEKLLKAQQRQPLSQFGLNQLIELLCGLCRKSEYQICAFVDGLDEYEGNGLQLLDILEEITHQSGIKICLASRQIHPFNDILRKYPALAMQEHNHVSMRSYISRQIVHCRSRCVDIEKRFPKQLQEAIILKAQGVLLWTKLVVDELINLAQENTMHEELLRVLDDLPQELEDIYQRILDRIEPQLRSEAAMHLQFIVAHGGAISSNVLLVATQLLSREIPGLVPYVNMEIEEFITRLHVLLAPLLDLQATRISLMHKTLLRYLRRTEWFKVHTTPEFRTQYPDHTWLRLNQSVLASGTSKSSHYHSIPLTFNEDFDRGFLSDELWRAVRQVLCLPDLLNPGIGEEAIRECADELPRRLRNVENVDDGTYEQITKILFTSREVCIYALVKSGPFHPDMSIPEFKKTWTDLTELIDCNLTYHLTFAITCRLPVLIGFILRQKPSMPDDTRQNVLNFAVRSLGGRQIFDPVLEVLSDGGRLFKTQHVCALMTKERLPDSKFRGDAPAPYVFENRVGLSWDTSHEPMCSSYGSDHRLLFDWARASTAGESGPLSDMWVDSWLKILIATGEDINGNCFPKGGVVEAMFTVAAKGWLYSDGRFLKKLVFLIDAGFKVPERPRLQAMLILADRKMRKINQANILKGFKNMSIVTKDYFQPHNHQLEWIIEILQFALQHDAWPDLIVYQAYRGQHLARFQGRFYQRFLFWKKAPTRWI